MSVAFLSAQRSKDPSSQVKSPIIIMTSGKVGVQHNLMHCLQHFSNYAEMHGIVFFICDLPLYRRWPLYIIIAFEIILLNICTLANSRNKASVTVTFYYNNYGHA